MNNRTHTVFLSLFILLAGCSSQQVTQPEVNANTIPAELYELSPTFISEQVQMRGKERLLAIADVPLITGTKNLVTWYLWGNIQDVTGKMTVIGYHKETGKSQLFLERIYVVPAKPLHGAANHYESLMQFPFSGTWRLDLFLNDRFIDRIVVPVK